MNRREIVKLGLVTVGCLGCGAGGEDTPADAADGIGVGFAMCGANICVDLADPANAVLANINGARAIAIPDKIIIVRESATTFVVMSRVCTHQGCVLAYQPSAMELTCGCHGSRFDLDRSVLRGPATRSLQKYANAFDEATQTLTILLA